MNDRLTDESKREEEKLSRVVSARLKLMRRFKEKMESSPAQSDTRPLGSGPTNRHGMPQLPIGQVYTKKWPVLDLGIRPQVSTEEWTLTIDGAVERGVSLDWGEMTGLEQTGDRSDLHCVTTWSKVDMSWRGVKVSTLLALAEPKPEATHVMCYAHDGYTTNVALEELLKDDVLLVHTYEGSPLTAEHGGPARVITPQLYAWKGAKWIKRFELLTEDRPGFWEQRGYSDTAHPWRDDRYR
jgi:DMSO/TMAO reductase YedYZ molybdopterin-dependent catalytic subunit